METRKPGSTRRSAAPSLRSRRSGETSAKKTDTGSTAPETETETTRSRRGASRSAVASPRAPAAGTAARSARRADNGADRPGDRKNRREAAAQTPVATDGKPRIKPPPVRPPARPAFARKLPGDPDGHVVDLLESLCALFDILVEENQALSELRFEDAKNLIETKVARTREYQRQMLAVHRNPALLLNLTIEQKEVMKAAGEALRTVATENGNRVKAGMDAIEMVVKSVFDAVREHATENTASYSDDGSVQPNMSIPENRTLTLNKTL